MKRTVKEFWVKFESREEYEKHKEELCSLLGQAPGDSLVCVYLADCRSVGKMSRYSFDESQIDLLAAAFGKENVVAKEKKEEVISRWDIREYYGEIFERIAGSLEGIEAALNTIAEHFENGGGNIASDK